MDTSSVKKNASDVYNIQAYRETVADLFAQNLSGLNLSEPSQGSGKCCYKKGVKSICFIQGNIYLI